MSLILSCVLNFLFFMEKTVEMYLKIVFNEDVFLNTLGFRKRKRNVTWTCSRGKIVLFKELTYSKNSSLSSESLLWFCHFNLTWCTHHASLLSVRVARVQKSSTLYLTKSKPYRVCTPPGVCIHCFVMSNDWKKKPIYLLHVYYL